MQTKQNSFVKVSRALALALSLCATAVLVDVSAVQAQTASAKVKQKTFASPEEAAKAAAEAVASHDRKTLASIFGPGSERLFSSGDAVADRQLGERFTELYSESHKVVPEGEGKAILQIGKNDWPLPVPIVKQGETWRFDTAAAQDEIIDRRIGRNELYTIQTILAIADAQQDYAAKDRNGDGLLAYAQKFRSSPGKRDGLYWPTKAGEELSPLGALAADASAQGYRAGAQGKPQPYHGYYFRILTGQGKDAPGGAYDYRVKGKMIGGFAILAYPASYGSSGVMTFMVNHDGVVYQKDLGPRTAALAGKIARFNPDSTWKKVDTAADTKS